jgi:Mg-chelatase subunit ChlD
MRADLADITLVVDRSGSMQSIRDDAEGGVNSFIAGQAQQPGQASLTLVQFDTEYEFIHRGMPVGQVPPYQLVPRGSTALLDAVGRAINETGSRLAAMAEADRPGLVVFVVVTDGQENSSREFTKARIKEMIEHQQTRYSWQFTFLGADQDAFAEGGSMGVAAAGIANFSKGNVRKAYDAVSAKLGRMRAARAVNDQVDNRFTTEEIAEMQEPADSNRPAVTGPTGKQS